MQNDANNIYMKKSEASTAMRMDNLFVVKLSLVLPFLIPLLTLIIKIRMFFVDKLRAILPPSMYKVEDLPVVWIMKQVGEVVEERLKSGKKRTDLLQLMLDVTTKEEIKVRFI